MENKSAVLQCGDCSRFLALIKSRLKIRYPQKNHYIFASVFPGKD